MTWVEVTPPVVRLGELEVIHPVARRAMSPVGEPNGLELVTVIKIPGHAAQASLTRAELGALAGALTAILDAERRLDIERQAEQDAARSSQTTARDGLLSRLR